MKVILRSIFSFISVLILSPSAWSLTLSYSEMSKLEESFQNCRSSLRSRSSDTRLGVSENQLDEIINKFHEPRPRWAFSLNDSDVQELFEMISRLPLEDLKSLLRPHDFRRIRSFLVLNRFFRKVPPNTFLFLEPEDSNTFTAALNIFCSEETVETDDLLDIMSHSVNYKESLQWGEHFKLVENATSSHVATAALLVALMGKSSNYHQQMQSLASVKQIQSQAVDAMNFADSSNGQTSRLLATLTHLSLERAESGYYTRSFLEKLGELTRSFRSNLDSMKTEEEDSLISLLQSRQAILLQNKARYDHLIERVRFYLKSEYASLELLTKEDRLGKEDRILLFRLWVFKHNFSLSEFYLKFGNLQKSMTLSLELAENEWFKVGRDKLELLSLQQVEELAVIHISGLSDLFVQTSPESRHQYQELFSQVIDHPDGPWKRLSDNPTTIDSDILSKNFIFVHEILDYFYRKRNLQKFEYWKTLLQSSFDD